MRLHAHQNTHCDEKRNQSRSAKTYERQRYAHYGQYACHHPHIDECISFGGTALITLFIAVGILMSVQSHRKLVNS